MQKEKAEFAATPNSPGNSLQRLSNRAVRWIKIAADLVPPAASTIAAAPAISATTAAIAAGTAAAVGRAAGTIAGKPAPQREAVARARGGVATAIAAGPGAGAPLAAVLEMGDPAVADRDDDPGSDQCIYHRVAHHRLPLAELRSMLIGRPRQRCRSLIIRSKYGTLPPKEFPRALLERSVNEEEVAPGN